MALFGSLIPKEGRFFDYFRESAELIVQGANEFRILLGDLPNAERHSRAIKDTEHKCDLVTHKTIELLHTTFITPMDREDIHKLIGSMDDILDLLYAAGQRIHLFEVSTMTAEGFGLADVCVLAAEQVKKSVLLLENLKDTDQIMKNCVEINRLENEADHLLRVGLAKLFKDEADVRTLIKMKEIYEILETVTDKCEDVANIIEGIVLEYA